MALNRLLTISLIFSNLVSSPRDDAIDNVRRISRDPSELTLRSRMDGLDAGLDADADADADAVRRGGRYCATEVVVEVDMEKEWDFLLTWMDASPDMSRTSCVSVTVSMSSDTGRMTRGFEVVGGWDSGIYDVGDDGGATSIWGEDGEGDADDDGEEEDDDEEDEGEDEDEDDVGK
jgi:hypothetical protein